MLHDLKQQKLNFQKIKDLFQEKLDKLILSLGIIFAFFVFVFLLVSLYRLIYFLKTPPSSSSYEFGINKNLYTEISRDFNLKNETKDNTLKKIDLLRDPFK